MNNPPAATNTPGGSKLIPPLVFLWAGVIVILAGRWTLLLTAPIVTAVAWHSIIQWRNVHMPDVRGPRLFPYAIKKRVLDNFKGCCGYCGRQVHFAAACPNRPAGCHDDYQADHATSWDDGGDTIEANCVAACRWCNQMKGTMSVDEFYAWLWSAEGQTALERRLSR